MVDYTNKVIQSKPLHRMFTAVPPRYDLINRVITFGLDRRWRQKAARECLASPPARVLDLCCGTGDLANSLARLSRDNVVLVGIDYSQPMLEIAARKVKPLVQGRKISFIYGDAANLPFTDGSFNCVGISFAFRNLTYKNPLAWRHLAEVFRVLSPGGKYVIVETSQPKSRLIRKLYRLYLRWFVFRLGKLLSRHSEAYRYLAESAARFYPAGEVREILFSAGFREVSCRPLLFGVVALHIAVK